MSTSYEIGPFRFDTEAEILFRADAPIAVGQRAVILLRVLVERAGTRVTKEALIHAVNRFVGPVAAWSAEGELPADAAPEAAPALPFPDKPSIAVLAFDNLSGDPEQEYFADGLAEDIITGLSKFHWFFVMARNHMGREPQTKPPPANPAQFSFHAIVRRKRPQRT